MLATTASPMYIQVNSMDFTAVAQGGTAQSFTNTLAGEVKLDRDKQYEVCVYDVMFPIRQNINSVYINSNLVDTTVITGSQQTNAVLWIPYSEFANIVNAEFYNRASTKVVSNSIS